LDDPPILVGAAEDDPGPRAVYPPESVELKFIVVVPAALVKVKNFE